ncbi:MAG: Spy/CpxP family protein refolding chaperone [Rhizobiaceae bacterium]
MSDTKNKPGFLKSDRSKIIATITGASLLIGASFAVPAIAESRLFQHAKLYASDTKINPFVQKAGWGERRGKRHGRWSNLSDSEIESRISRAVKHVAIEIDATEEQTTKIATLLSAVAKDMKPLHKEFRDAGEQLRTILTGSTVDRVALEKLRAERVAEIDKRSRQLVNAMADVAEVLDAGQRKKLEERIEEFRSMRRRWHRG